MSPDSEAAFEGQAGADAPTGFGDGHVSHGGWSMGLRQSMPSSAKRSRTRSILPWQCSQTEASGVVDQVMHGLVVADDEVFEVSGAGERGNAQLSGRRRRRRR